MTTAQWLVYCLGLIELTAASGCVRAVPSIQALADAPMRYAGHRIVVQGLLSQGTESHPMLVEPGRSYASLVLLGDKHPCSWSEGLRRLCATSERRHIRVSGRMAVSERGELLLLLDGVVPASQR